MEGGNRAVTRRGALSQHKLRWSDFEVMNSWVAIEMKGVFTRIYVRISEAGCYLTLDELFNRSLTHKGGPSPSTTATAELPHLAPHTSPPTSSSLSQHTPSHSSDTLCLAPATARTFNQHLSSTFRGEIMPFCRIEEVKDGVISALGMLLTLWRHLLPTTCLQGSTTGFSAEPNSVQYS